MTDDYCPHGVMRGVRCGPCEEERATPWLETWMACTDSHAPNNGKRIAWVEDEHGEIVADVPNGPASAARARLAAAAPALVRALLACEKTGIALSSAACCPVCGYTHPFRVDFFAHERDCSVDAALIAADLPDQKSRDAARKGLGR